MGTVARGGNPEIGKERPAGRAARIEQHVLGLHIAVDDPSSVRSRQGISNLSQQVHCLPQGKPAAAGELLSQRWPCDQRHDQERVPCFHANIVEGDDVGVAEPGNRPCLGLQALMGGQGSLSQQLDRYCPAELFVSGPPDGGYPTAGNQLLQAIAPG
jgi:hypothetical protein